MNYNDCKQCENDCKQCEQDYLKTIKRQRAIILHYSKEADFYRKIAILLILLFILTIVVLYLNIK